MKYTAKFDLHLPGGREVKKGEEVTQAMFADLSPSYRVSLLQSGNVEVSDVKDGERDMLVPQGPEGSAVGERTPEQKEADEKAEQEAAASKSPGLLSRVGAALAPNVANKTEERAATPAVGAQKKV